MSIEQSLRELNRSFISDELRTQESDMVFSLPFRTPTQTCEQVIVYLLIEHQSTVDRSMELRLLSYMVQIWMEERRQWTEAKQPEARVAGNAYYPDCVLHRESENGKRRCL